MDIVSFDSSGNAITSGGGVAAAVGPMHGTPGGGGVIGGSANVPLAVTVAVLAAGSATGFVVVLAVIVCCRCFRRSTSGSGSKMPKKRQSSDSSSCWLDDQFSSSLISARCLSSSSSIYRQQQQQPVSSRSTGVSPSRLQKQIASPGTRSVTGEIVTGHVTSSRTSIVRPYSSTSTGGGSLTSIRLNSSTLAGSKESSLFEVISERPLTDTKYRARFSGVTSAVTLATRHERIKRVERRHTDGEFRRHLSPLQVQGVQSPQSSTVGTSALAADSSSDITDAEAVNLTRLNPPSLLFAHARTSNASPVRSPTDLQSSMTETDIDDVNEASITELTPMLPADWTNKKRSSVNVVVVNQRCAGTNHLRSLPEPALSSLFEQREVQSRTAEVESHRQTIVVEVYHPSAVARVRRPMSLCWNRQRFEEAEKMFQRADNGSAIGLSAHSRSAPELRSHSSDQSRSVFSRSKVNDVIHSGIAPTANKIATVSTGEGTATGIRSNQFRVHETGNAYIKPKSYTEKSLDAVSLSALPTSDLQQQSTAHWHRPLVLSLPQLTGTGSVASTSAPPEYQYPVSTKTAQLVPSPPAENQAGRPRRRPGAKPESMRVSHIASVVSPSSVESIVSHTVAREPDSNTATDSTSATLLTPMTAANGGDRSWQDASMELWNLRAMLADRDDDYSVEDSLDDESIQTAAASAPTVTTTPQSADDTSAKSSSDTVVSVIDTEEMRRPSASVNDVLPSSADVITSEASSRVDAASGCTTVTDEDPSSTAGTTAVPEDGLRRVPSVRRQTYRNAIARRQQQKNQQRLGNDETVGPTASPAAGNNAESSVGTISEVAGGCGRRLVPPSAGDGSSELTDDTESSISFERHFGTGGYCASISAAASSIDTASSFRDSVTSNDSIGGGNSSCSEGHGGNGSHRLESLRGDSGYRSLEAQQSLAAAAVIGGTVLSGLVSGSVTGSSRDIRRLSVAAPAEVIREDERESVVSPTIKTNAIPETVVKLPSPLTAVRHTCRMTTASGGNRQHVVVVRHSKAAERKRIQYKCERQAVQIYESVAGDSSASTSAQQQQQQNDTNATLSTGNIGITKSVRALTPSATKLSLFDRMLNNRHSFPSYIGNSVNKLTGESFDDQLSAGLATVFSDHHPHHRHHHRRHHHHPQCQQNQLQQPQIELGVTSVSKSSFFSRLLRTSPTGSGSGVVPGSSSSPSRRCPLVRMHQRDYSVDERSDALFNEFMRHDPAFDSMHTLCVTARRRSGGHRTHHSGGGRSSRRRSAIDSPDDRSPSERRHRLRRVSHDVDRASQAGDRTTHSSTGSPMIGSRASEIIGRSSPSAALVGAKLLLLGGLPSGPSGPTASSVAFHWLEAAIASAHIQCHDNCSSSANVSSDRRASCGDTSRSPISIVSERTTAAGRDASRITGNDDQIATSGQTSTSNWMTSSTTTRPSVVAYESTMNAVASVGSANNSPESASQDTVGDSSPGSDDVISSSEQRNVVGIVSVSSVGPHTTRSIPVIQLTTEDETLFE